MFVVCRCLLCVVRCCLLFDARCLLSVCCSFAVRLMVCFRTLCVVCCSLLVVCCLLLVVCLLFACRSFDVRGL